MYICKLNIDGTQIQLQPLNSVYCIKSFFLHYNTTVQFIYKDIRRNSSNTFLLIAVNVTMLSRFKRCWALSLKLSDDNVLSLQYYQHIYVTVGMCHRAKLPAAPLATKGTPGPLTIPQGQHTDLIGTAKFTST